ncbi:Dihydrofolate reductase [Mesorhizobium albiziae]|uniref:Dihydrofolate reductase n=1 Tax=Neomesorhizobium albiziae TaxID=335020 RepID=A0A1I4BVU1_9HYPH|nr:dihydrofolate reductase family protein [Mesorhizobium albiziae]GLS29626.1 riboflavin biosynthesis protein RibD [Mesorhizobium albiziae]SFK72785.1 Dihydrofolate reductase [Mesorhizobium albiziae]
MRKIVFQMMTTLNGRLDDPMAWLSSVSDDQYQAIDRLYARYDTVLVGRTTYEEMAAYWPGALSEGTETNRKMARRMRDLKKLVFSRSGHHELTAWSNTERVTVTSDDELTEYLTQLKAEPGADIHLSGGASFARSVIGLGVVDAFHFFVYPTVSPGISWFADLPDKRDMRLLGSSSYENGVVGLHYAPAGLAERAQPSSFTDLLT